MTERGLLFPIFLGRYFREELAEPLGLDIHIGLPESFPKARIGSIQRMPLLSVLFHMRRRNTISGRMILEILKLRSLTGRVFSNPRMKGAIDFNADPAMRAVEIPSVFATGGSEIGLRKQTLDGLIDNRAVATACYRPEYTFVEKIQTVVRKFRQFREDGKIKPNFLRHYYDIYMLLDCDDVLAFIGTDEYIKHKADRIRGKDKEFGIAPAFDILHPDLEAEYARTSNLYYRGQVPLTEIVDRITPYLDKL